MESKCKCCLNCECCDVDCQSCEDCGCICESFKGSDDEFFEKLEKLGKEIKKMGRCLN